MIEWLRQAPPDAVEIGGRSLPLVIRRHPRATRLTMRLGPCGGEVRITLPRWGRTRDALAFVEARRDWLEHQLAAIPRPAPVLPGGVLAFRGRDLRIDWNERHARSPCLAEGSVRLGGAERAVPTRLRRWLEEQALQLFSEDLRYYCACAGVPAPSLRLSRAQRRWGSCSHRGPGMQTVRINWRLIQAPDAVRRSVVAHEVAHLLHFDHSPAFYALLARLYEGDLAQADRWLREQGRSLYSAFG